VKDRLISIIRTLVPQGVGAVAGWLAMIGIDLPDSVTTHVEAAVTAAAVAAAGSAYYVTVRAIEQRFPWAGYLLGHPAVPTYRSFANFARGGTVRPGRDGIRPPSW
jgi:hypothetical protein